MIIVNGRRITIESYPNREVKVKSFAVGAKNTVELKYEDDKDLVHLMFVKNYMDEIDCCKNCSLLIHYMPYSRMDRQIGDDLFTLSYICEFINELKFDKITVVDPHSDQTLKLLKNANAVYPVKQWLPNILLEIGFNLNFDCIIFPDKGAKLKYQGMMSDVLIRRSFMKVRNPVTGVIESTTLEYKLPKDCKKCVIVDDLCSKGGTFLWAGKILRQNGVEDITLAVSHCEDSVFEGSMFEPYSTINRIYTSNSILSPGSYRNIKVLPVNYEMV